MSLEHDLDADLQSVEDPTFRDVIPRLLEMDPGLRISLAEFLEHPYFFEIQVEDEDDLELDFDTLLKKEKEIEKDRKEKDKKIKTIEPKKTTAEAKKKPEGT